MKAASESFERALKETISNALEGFDGVDKLSYDANKWGVSFYSMQVKFLSHSTFSLVQVKFIYIF